MILTVFLNWLSIIHFVRDAQIPQAHVPAPLLYGTVGAPKATNFCHIQAYVTWPFHEKAMDVDLDSS